MNHRKITNGSTLYVLLAMIVAICPSFCLMAKTATFKCDGEKYFASYDETSHSNWWVDNYVLSAGDDLVFWQDSAGKTSSPAYLKRVVSNWPKNLGTVTGNATWIIEQRDLCANPSTISIADARDFFGWWRFLRRITVKFPQATSSFTPVLQRLETGSRVNLQVESAESKVVVSNLFGSGFVKKSGAGNLDVVQTGGDYASVEHAAGTLTLHEQGKVGGVTAESVLAKALVHFDASDVSKFEYQNGKISKWHASAPNSQYYAQAVTTNKYNMGAPMFTNLYKKDVLPLPVYRAGYSVTGLGVVDFGPFRSYDAADADTCGASTLEFMRSGARVNYSEVFIVFADVDPQCRCDVFCDSHNRTFTRGASYNNHDTGILQNYNGGIVCPPSQDNRPSSRNAKEFRVNGKLVPSSFPLAGSNLKVVSMDCSKDGNAQASESVLGSFARTDSMHFGGQIVAEFIGFSSNSGASPSLSAEERQALNRYLMKKWLGKDDQVNVALNHVKASNGVALNVPANEEAGVYHVSAGDKLVKKGEGTLAVGDIHACGTSRPAIEVQGGRVAFRSYGTPAAANPTAASSPRYHFDASDLASLTTNVVDGKTFVERWADQHNSDTYAYPVTTEFSLKSSEIAEGSKTPAKPSLQLNACNGLPVIYFGGRRDTATLKKTGYGDSAAMLFSKRADDSTDNRANVFEGFAVFSAVYCSYPFSSLQYSVFYPSGWALIHDRYGMTSIKGGVVTLDGEVCNPSEPNLLQSREGQYIVVHFAANERVHVGGTGFDLPNPGGVGGIKVGEVIFYDRRLNERERHDTEAYLMKKWLGKDHPMRGAELASLDFADGVPAAVDTDVDMSVLVRTTSSNFSKAGSGTLKAALPSSATAVSVEGGEFQEQTVASNVLASALMHLDASVPESFEYAADSSDDIEFWRDVRGNGHPYAWRDENRYSGYPTLSADERTGLPTVDFGTTVYNTASPDGKKDKWHNYPNSGKALCLSSRLHVREGYLVLRHNDHATFFGCYEQNPFHPNEVYLVDANNSASILKNQTEWHTDEELINPFGYSWADFAVVGKGVHVLSFAITNACSELADYTNCAGIETLVSDRANIAGGLQLSEVVVFDRNLTAAERTSLRKYLEKKWQTADVDLPQPGHVLASLSVASGAKASFLGATEVAALSGTGTVDGDLVLTEDVILRGTYSGTSVEDGLTVNGSLTIPDEGLCAEITVLSKPKGGDYVDLVTAKSISGDVSKLRLSLVDAFGRPYTKRPAEVKLENGHLRAVFGRFGLSILVK